MQGYKQTCTGNSMITLVVGILVCITWLVLPYPNNIVGKDYVLILKSIKNSALR